MYKFKKKLENRNNRKEISDKNTNRCRVYKYIVSGGVLLFLVLLIIMAATGKLHPKLPQYVIDNTCNMERKLNT